MVSRLLITILGNCLNPVSPGLVHANNMNTAMAAVSGNVFNDADHVTITNTGILDAPSIGGGVSVSNVPGYVGSAGAAGEGLYFLSY